MHKTREVDDSYSRAPTLSWQLPHLRMMASFSCLLGAGWLYTLTFPKNATPISFP